MIDSIARKLGKLAKDRTLRRWLWERAIGRTGGEPPFEPHRPSYLNSLPIGWGGPVATGNWREIPDGFSRGSLTLPLPGETVELQPGGEAALFASSFADTETLLALHRFAWLPLLGDTVDPVWVAVLWRTWADNFAEPDGSWAWHPYTAAERAVNLLEFGRRHGLPGPLHQTLELLGAHAPAIAEKLEYFGDHHTSNHLANNGRGLFLIGRALGLDWAVAMGGRILMEEAGRIFAPSGVLREGSSHYHLLLTRQYASAWLAARGQPEEPALEEATRRALAVIPHLALPGGMPLVGDISPDCPPDFLAGLIPGEDAAQGWTGLLDAEDRDRLVALRDAAEGTLGDGWLRAAYGPWTGLWHAAPEGWSHMPGHGHQDAGSFELHFEDEPVVVDPGRGAYGETGDAAEYVCAVRHNTLSIDGRDPYPPNKPYYDAGFRRRVGGKPPVLRIDGDGVMLRHWGFKRFWGVGAVERRWSFEGRAWTLPWGMPTRRSRASSSARCRPSRMEPPWCCRADGGNTGSPPTFPSTYVRPRCGGPTVSAGKARNSSWRPGNGFPSMESSRWRRADVRPGRSLPAGRRAATGSGPGGHAGEDRRFQLGFNRLAIIDLETGDQPIVEDGGARVLAGNGEIYNYRELRNDPRCRDYAWQTQGDMEVVLPLARASDLGFVEDLMGMYGLALYERDRHRLVLVRDRLGIKPLYWARVAGGGVVFASEIKALFASGLLSPAVDEWSVSAYLAHGYVPSPRTLYEGVRKLPPAHVAVADKGTVRLHRYWRPERAPDLPEGEPEIRAHLTGLLRESVRLHLRSDVDVGALLSGGIDSGLVVALAAEESDRPLKTFTVSFEGAAVDEAPLARMVAERYGTEHTELTLSADSIARHLPTLAWHADEPLWDASLLPNHLIEKVLGGRVKVALNGTGGDELFAGYGRYFRLEVEERYLRIFEGVRHGLIEPVLSRFAPMLAWKLRRAEKFDRNRGAYLHDHSAFFPWPMRDLIGNGQNISEPAQSAFFAEFEGPDDSAALAAELCTYLPEDLLTLLDRTSMAWGVEGRVPFLDHRLVAAALAVPPEIRAPGGRQKTLERAIARPFLPSALIDAPKQGFASPVPAWFAGEMKDLARRILASPRALERGWWTGRGIERLLARPDVHAFRLYALLMLEMCVRVHVEGEHHFDDGLEAYADAA